MNVFRRTENIILFPKEMLNDQQPDTINKNAHSEKGREGGWWWRGRKAEKDPTIRVLRAVSTILSSIHNPNHLITASGTCSTSLFVTSHFFPCVSTSIIL